ncbi:hypothetical protein [Nitrospira sp. BLG_1]|uniref:hypothetical protein n=1 Tax=Nitrospira sp. BLG_1 TaxID=3395883 RepID=UPI0039BCFFCF
MARRSGHDASLLEGWWEVNLLGSDNMQCAHDPAGNLNQFTDRKNHPTTFKYDVLDHGTKAIYFNATTTLAVNSSE